MEYGKHNKENSQAFMQNFSVSVEQMKEHQYAGKTDNKKYHGNKWCNIFSIQFHLLEFLIDFWKFGFKIEYNNDSHFSAV